MSDSYESCTCPAYVEGVSCSRHDPDGSMWCGVCGGRLRFPESKDTPFAPAIPYPDGETGENRTVLIDTTEGE